MAALYNLERPTTLSEVVGQDNIKRQLAAAGGADSTLQSMLFIGPRGTGKTSTARIWAKTVNCEHPAEDGSPCGECPTCRAIAEGSCIDVLELDAASNNGVDDVHQVIAQAQYAPAAKKKVFILDEVHMFSTAAWNALLKTIEEPPKDAVFILCTTEENKVPSTIISRCRKFMFERLGVDTIKEHLQNICDKHGKCADADALTLIARASDGCMRDALSILESFFDNDNIITDIVAGTLGLSDENLTFDCLEAIMRGDAKAAIGSFRGAVKNGGSVASFIKALVSALTDVLYLLQGASADSIINTAVYKERAVAFKAHIGIDRAMELTSRLSEVYGSIGKAADAEFLVEASILQTLTYQSELEALRGRVEALEKGAIRPTQQAVAISEQVSEPEPEEEVTLQDIPDEDAFFDQMAQEMMGADEEVGGYDLSGLDAELPDVQDAGFGGVETDTSEPAEEPTPVEPQEKSVDKSMFHVVKKADDGTEERGTDVSDDTDVLDLLPPGTKVIGLEELEANANETGADDAVETEDGAGESTALPAFGFDGLDGWL